MSYASSSNPWKRWRTWPDAASQRSNSATTSPGPSVDASLPGRLSAKMAASPELASRPRPSGVNRAATIPNLWPARRRISCPVAASHRISSPGDIIESPEKPPEASVRPSGLRSTVRTMPEWPLKRRTSAAVCRSHRITWRSSPLESARVPSALTAMSFTLAVCPARMVSAGPANPSGLSCITAIEPSAIPTRVVRPSGPIVSAVAGPSVPGKSAATSVRLRAPGA